jgi:Flp pilus assembly protein TadG
MIRFVPGGFPPWPGKRRGRSAMAVVEFAVLLPVLSMIMLGMLELSRAVMVKQMLTDAARKGCRTGIIQQFGNSDISNDATDVMRDNGFSTTQFNPPTVGVITITVTDPYGNTLSDSLNAPPGSVISVQVSIPVSSFAWVSPYFLSSSTLESDLVVMMKQ